MAPTGEWLSKGGSAAAAATPTKDAEIFSVGITLLEQ